MASAITGKCQLQFAISQFINDDSQTVSSTTKEKENLFAEPRRVTNLSDCFFYHAMDLPIYGSVDGQWDLRGKESQYLGEVAFSGKRVLEIGPASGHLSFYMEREGAEVVSVEAGDDNRWEFFWDIPDGTPAELSEKIATHREMMLRLKNSYWLAHSAFGSNARVHYGSAYDIPNELGQFDISVLGCVLLHNKSPLQILEDCAKRTRETIVVVEVFRETQLSQTRVVFQPGARERQWHTWWSFSPVYFSEILHSMGFTEQRVSFHHQICKGEPTALFTVVANRTPVGVVADERQVNVTLSSVVTGLNIEAGQIATVPVRIVNEGQVSLSSASEYPVLLSYHWKNELDELTEWDGLRTPLLRTLHSGDHEDLLMAIRAPSEAGQYTLDITLLKEHVTWYHDLIPGLPLRIRATVT